MGNVLQEQMQSVNVELLNVANKLEKMKTLFGEKKSNFLRVTIEDMEQRFCMLFRTKRMFERHLKKCGYIPVRDIPLKIMYFMLPKEQELNPNVLSEIFQGIRSFVSFPYMKDVSASFMGYDILLFTEEDITQEEAQYIWGRIQLMFNEGKTIEAGKMLHWFQEKIEYA